MAETNKNQLEYLGTIVIQSISALTNLVERKGWQTVLLDPSIFDCQRENDDPFHQLKLQHSQIN